MITGTDLRLIARARLREAHVLLHAKRFDGAYYLSGYAVETGLKARICRTLKWAGFPETAQDFKGLQSLKTHDLNTLLRLSGVGVRVKAKRLDDWFVVLAWTSGVRYQPIGRVTEQQATTIVTSAQRLLEVL